MSILNRPVVTLNQSLQPIGTVNVERAMALLYTQRAYAVKFDEKNVIRFPGGQVPVPEIIAIPSASFFKLKPVPLNRHNVFSRDQYCCMYCRGAFAPKDLTIDHLYPRSRFSELKEKLNLDFNVNSWSNLVTSCKKCNSKKDNKTLSELGWPDVKPETPLSHLEVNWDEVMAGVENVSSLDISALWK